LRTKNATVAVVKDNGFIVGLNPEAGSPEGWHWRYHGSTVIAPISWLRHPLLRVRAYSQNTLAVSPPLVSEILSAPPGFFKFKRSTAFAFLFVPLLLPLI